MEKHISSHITVMYLGESIETAKSEELLKNTQIYKALRSAGLSIAQTDMRTPIALAYCDDSRRDIVRGFAEAGIAVVSGAAFESLGVNAARIACPSGKDTDLLVRLIERARF